MADFAGKAVLVTGASSGIGAATARAFAREDAAVILADLNVDAGERLAEELRSAGHRAAFVRCDVRKERDIEAAVASSIEHFGRLDIAFNNAGIEGIQAAAADCTADNWDQVVGVNLRGVWLSMKYEIRAMLEIGGGAIVNCASVAGMVSFPRMPAYVASKHGVIGLTKTAALDYARKNIRVNAVCPGVIDTPLLGRFDEKTRQSLAAAGPMGRMGQPEEVAEAVLWLAHPAASFTTGHALLVDGAWVAR
jgi:NAD(P)-dependent dehydrogenase (short-subunit alcohol dehydrogenase family)